jgi:hypothetical protein
LIATDLPRIEGLCRPLTGLGGRFPIVPTASALGYLLPSLRDFSKAAVGHNRRQMGSEDAGLKRRRYVQIEMQIPRAESALGMTRLRGVRVLIRGTDAGQKAAGLRLNLGQSTKDAGLKPGGYTKRACDKPVAGRALPWRKRKEPRMPR